MAANTVNGTGFSGRLGSIPGRYYFSVGHLSENPCGGRRPTGGVYLSPGTKVLFCPAGTPVI